MSGPSYAALQAAPAPDERPVATDADKTKGAFAESLSKRLVVFESRRDPDNKRLGIPFTAFANSPMHLAYDPSSRQVMAQWTAPGLIGNRRQYQAYMDVNGALSFVLSAGF